ncbi:MAG: Asp-tRNA(Asn)/Glu-tRNA(Gln) amidotransferase subunit GatA [Negativicutes bacterium]|jgi:aspartyl-tRNA(Asn)/glutamyl-tRNA(Gln) amidotransferase subunit A
MELYRQTINQLQTKITAGEITASDVVASVSKRITEVDAAVEAFITVCADAKANVDNIISRSPLAGMPGAVKDNICTQGIRTTCGSRILENFIPPYNATVVDRLNEAGAVIIGKANQDEFGMGSSTENSGYHITRNPWDLSRVPGGSSGGSAAAVASGQALWALGSDTGGSVRLPAAFCGIVGLKPTYGRVSRYGLVAYASSLDTIGALTRDVYDNALVMNVIAGYDEHDSTSINIPREDYTANIAAGVRGLKIGLPKQYYGEGLSPEVALALEQAIQTYRELGAEIIEVDMPNTDYALSTYYIIATAEASSNLARYDGVSYGLRVEGDNIVDMSEKTREQGFSEEVRRRIMLGTYTLSAGYYDAYYNKALKVRRLIKNDFDAAFKIVDLLLTPVAPTQAFKIGEKTDDPLTMYLSDVCTVTVNLAGVPALSLPCAFANNLPIGMQLIGAPLSEALLLRAGYAFERVSGLANKIAPCGGEQ